MLTTTLHTMRPFGTAGVTRASDRTLTGTGPCATGEHRGSARHRLGYPTATGAITAIGDVLAIAWSANGRKPMLVPSFHHRWPLSSPT